jgi:hypothetical protein
MSRLTFYPADGPAASQGPLANAKVGDCTADRHPVGQRAMSASIRLGADGRPVLPSPERPAGGIPAVATITPDWPHRYGQLSAVLAAGNPSPLLRPSVTGGHSERHCGNAAVPVHTPHPYPCRGITITIRRAAKTRGRAQEILQAW